MSDLSIPTGKLPGEHYKCAICGSGTLASVSAKGNDAHCVCVCGFQFTMPGGIGRIGEPVETYPMHLWILAAAEEIVKAATINISGLEIGDPEELNSIAAQFAAIIARHLPPSP